MPLKGAEGDAVNESASGPPWATLRVCPDSRLSESGVPHDNGVISLLVASTTLCPPRGNVEIVQRRVCVEKLDGAGAASGSSVPSHLKNNRQRLFK